jgi:Uma2 family endonuclease
MKGGSWAILPAETASASRLAPIDVVLSEVDVVQPDLVFVRADRLDLITETNLRGAPDLTAEIVSESTRGRDELTKRHLYERHGVGEYWIVDPVVERVSVYRLGEDRRYRRLQELSHEDADTVESSLFPGFELPPSELFG